MRTSAAIFLPLALLGASSVSAYPPAVGIVGDGRSCLDCHADNGPWTDSGATIIDLLDSTTRQSLRQPDGSFLVEVERHETRKVVTVLGRRTEDQAPRPTRNAWLYVDPGQLGTSALSKFAPGWDVNLPMACRIVGDDVPEYPGAAATALPMVIRPGDAARDAELELQVMMTAGESAKGSPDDWLQANYLIRTVFLRVIDP